jgi:prolyl-tRNA synthetase
MFNIMFEDESGKEKKYVWQNSWGLTTRSIGILIMVHGDNKGLVLPPRVAPLQVVVIPIHFKEGANEVMDKKARDVVAALLSEKGIRAHCDDRDNYNPGWKYSHWELKGVPLRLELGPKDVEKNQVLAVRRDTGAKEPIGLDVLDKRITALLDEIQASLLQKAKDNRDQSIAQITTWEEFVPALDGKKIVRAPWCNETPCENKIKERSSTESKQEENPKENDPEKGGETFEKLTGAAKTLCIPLEQDPLQPDAKCFACGNPSKCWTLLGRSY